MSEVAPSSKQPSKKDLETLISSNLSKIAALDSAKQHRLSPSIGSPSSNKNGKIDIAQSVLAELRGRQKPPPRPSEPPKIPQHQQQLQQPQQHPQQQQQQQKLPLKPSTTFIQSQ